MKQRFIILFVLLPAVLQGVAVQRRNAPETNNFGIDDGKPANDLDSSMVRQLFFSALREKTIENYQLAADLFNRILQIDPTNDASLYELARIKRLQNNEAAARELFEKAVAVKPNNEYYWLALAESYEKTNNITKLESVFKELIRINPDKPEYEFDSANACFLQKKYDEALAIYKHLEKNLGLSDEIIAGRQKIYLKQGKINQATDELEEMIRINPDKMRYYILLAELYNSNGLNDKALKVLEKAEKVKDNNGIVHLALADIYRDKKDDNASFKQLKLAFAIPDLSIDQKIHIISGYLSKFPDVNAKANALELGHLLILTHPLNAKAFNIYGDILMQTEKYKEARPVYKKAVELNNQIYASWEQLVRVDLIGSQLDDAVKDGEEALTLFPNQAWLNYLVGIACLQKKDYKKALSYVSNVPSLETQDNSLLSQTYSAIGDCYHGFKDNKKSDEAYGKSIQYNPDNVYTLNNFAYYLSLRGEDLDKAAEMSKHANDLQPNNSSFEDTYAWILFKQKKYAEARVWIEKALVNDKDKNPIEVEHYGDILFYLGDTVAALQKWNKAKQLGNDTPVLDRKINEKKYIE